MDGPFDWLDEYIIFDASITGLGTLIVFILFSVNICLKLGFQFHLTLFHMT